MKFEKQTEAIKNFFIRLGKRNLIIICAVLLVGVAVTVNWVYFAGRNNDDTPAGADTNPPGEAVDNVDSYFSASQVSRQRARDEALEVLQSVVEDEAAGEEAKAAALADITQMAKDMESEAKIETLILAKGYSQCVAVIGGGSISIVVKTDGEALNASQIAQINTIVYEQAGIAPSKINIMEK